MENDLLHSAGRRSPLAVQVMSGPLTFLSFPGAAPPSFASSQPLSLHLWLSLSAVLNLCPVILAELHALVVQQQKRTCVFRAAVLQPAGNSFHPVFFFPLLAAPCTMWELPLHWEQRGHRTPQGRPSTVVYIREGPSPAFLMSWFAFGESRKSHSSWVFTAAGVFSLWLLPGNTWHFMVLSLPILKARHAGRAGLQQTRAAQRCLNKADGVQFVGRL